jgi:hypothetical protein
MTTVTVGVEWINDFHTGACSQNQLVYMNTHAEGFASSMVANGHVSVFDWGTTTLGRPTFGTQLLVVEGTH